MPFHGESREITKPDWSLNDCADMLLEILDNLQIPRVIAIGHSWIRMFKLQHTLLFFRKFYTKQAAKSLFGKSSLNVNPQLHDQLQRPMNILTIDDIKQIDKKVILDAEDATTMILNLKVKAIALKGKEDYVPTPPKIETVIVDGGHISPLEEPLALSELVERFS